MPVLLNAKQVTPRWWASFNMETVWHVFESQTQTYGSLPTCPVATNCLSGCNAKLSTKTKFLSIYMQKKKSALEPRCPCSKSSTQFLKRSEKQYCATPPPPFGRQEQVNYKVASSILSVTGTVCWYPCLLLGGERHQDSKVSLTEEHNKMTQLRL